MNRIKYLDTLKFVAIFAIIIVHVSGIWSNTEILNYKIHNLKEIFRFSIYMFIMVTGCLAFNKEIELSKYLNKKFVRILLPVIFFTIVAILLSVYSPSQPLSKCIYTTC